MKQAACFTLTTVNGGKMNYVRGRACLAVAKSPISYC
jgi:hypothetical protein